VTHLQRFIGLITTEAGCQVLAVGNTKKECFLVANFKTMRICQRDAAGKHLSLFWHILGSLVARVGQCGFCLTLFFHVLD